MPRTFEVTIRDGRVELPDGLTLPDGAAELRVAGAAGPPEVRGPEDEPARFRTLRDASPAESRRIDALFGPPMVVSRDVGESGERS